jgi:hypothetical protein
VCESLVEKGIKIAERSARSDEGEVVGWPIVDGESCGETMHGCADNRRLMILDTYIVVDGAKMRTLDSITLEETWKYIHKE